MDNKKGVKMKIITLIGSIATQRALKLISQDAIKIVKYLPKLSIATLFDNSASNINLEMQDVSNDIFTKGLISYDLKNNVLENNNSNMIVLDFLDDIYDFLVNRTTNHTLTASNYLLKYDLDKSLFTDYERIKHFSEEGIEIWKNGCSNFIKEVSHINIVLVKTYIPLYYLDENNHKVMLKGKLKNTIDNINSSLKIYYRYLESQVDCTTIEIQQEFLVEFVSSSGFNLSVASREFEKKVATEFLKQCNIQSALVPSLEERLESFFSIYNSFLELDADIPSIKELYDIGNKYLSKSMYKEAKKCEKLIMLLHNSSVPLSCKLGKGVSFGYGGIGTIVHANAEIGDFVVLGSNITIGGGKFSNERWYRAKST